MQTNTQREVGAHTPGPWRFEIGRWTPDSLPVGFAIRSDYRHPKLPADMRMHHIAGANMGEHAYFPACFSAEEIEANARLIAAAPDLLEALKHMVRAYVSLLEAGRDRITSLGGDCDPVDVMERGNPTLNEAKAAIAKAVQS